MHQKVKHALFISGVVTAFIPHFCLAGTEPLRNSYELVAQYQAMEKACVGFQNSGHRYSALIDRNLQDHFEVVIEMFKSLALEQAGCMKLDVSTIEDTKKAARHAYNQTREAQMYKILIPAAMTDVLIAQDVVDGCNAFIAQAETLKRKFKDQNIHPKTCAPQ